MGSRPGFFPPFSCRRGRDSVGKGRARGETAVPDAQVKWRGGCFGKEEAWPKEKGAGKWPRESRRRASRGNRKADALAPTLRYREANGSQGLGLAASPIVGGRVRRLAGPTLDLSEAEMPFLT